MRADAASPLPRRGLFGRLPDGRAVEWLDLDNGRGLAARLITLGASLQSLWVPDRHGVAGDIVLGHDDPAAYLAHRLYMGAVVGRYANRIAGGGFRLDGREYRLSRNDGRNCLHGGTGGLDRLCWTIADHGPTHARLTCRSPDGADGFPGSLDIQADYCLTDDALMLTLSAVTDRPTIVNLTGHPYFNLGGVGMGRDIGSHHLTLAADHYTEIDEHLIPTGRLCRVADRPFDFTAGQTLGPRLDAASDPQMRLAGGYDHNFVLRPRTGDGPLFAARLADPHTGRVLELSTTEPGLQFYSGNALPAGLIGKGGRPIGVHQAMCLEPQKFPDSPNRPTFPSARLDPGETYRHVTIWRFPTIGCGA